MVRMVNSGHRGDDGRAAPGARRDRPRASVIKFEGCYHGHGDSFLVKAGSGAATFGTPDSPGVTEATARDTLTVALQRPRRRCARAFAAHPGAVAAVIVEPVVGNMGVVRPLPGFLQGLRELCTRERRAAHLRRGDDRLPRRARRRAGALRRPARPDDARQDHRRRTAGRRLRRAREPDGARLAGRPGLPGRHAVGQPAGDGGRSRDAADASSATPRLYARLEALGARSRTGFTAAIAAARAALPTGARRLDVDAVLHAPSAWTTGRSAARADTARFAPLLPRDARRGRAARPVAVRGELPLGCAHACRHRAIVTAADAALEAACA